MYRLTLRYEPGRRAGGAPRGSGRRVGARGSAWVQLALAPERSVSDTDASGSASAEGCEASALEAPPAGLQGGFHAEGDHAVPGSEVRRRTRAPAPPVASVSDTLSSGASASLDALSSNLACAQSSQQPSLRTKLAATLLRARDASCAAFLTACTRPGAAAPPLPSSLLLPLPVSLLY